MSGSLEAAGVVPIQGSVRRVDQLGSPSGVPMSYLRQRRLRNRRLRLLNLDNPR